MQPAKSTLEQKVGEIGIGATALVATETLFEGFLSVGGSSWTGLPLTDLLHDRIFWDDFIVPAVYGIAGVAITRAATELTRTARRLYSGGKLLGGSAKQRAEQVASLAKEAALGVGAAAIVASMYISDHYMHAPVPADEDVPRAIVGLLSPVIAIAARPLAGFLAKKMAYGVTRAYQHMKGVASDVA